MRGRAIAASVLVVGLMAFAAPAALAGQQDTVTGGGQTPLSASFGFNGRDDLKGNFNYNSDPHGATPEFHAHCKGLDGFFLESHVNRDGLLVESGWVRATCYDQDGATVYLLAAFYDRGEPPFDDGVCILWSYDGPPRKVHARDAYIHDHGLLQSGNIQAHDS